MQPILLYTGAAAITLWGIAHIIPTANVIAGFGNLSTDNRRILTMEWVAEGLTLCFLGILVFLVTFYTPDTAAATITVRAVTAMLFVMAAWSQVTGARTAVMPMKLCPLIKSVVAVLFAIGV